MDNLNEQYSRLNDWSKLDFIKRLEYLDQDEKWELFNCIISDENDYDLARIEVLQIASIANIPSNAKASIASSITKVIKNTLVYEVKNYATNALENFTEFADVIDLLKSLLFDTGEDIDIRYNALNAVQNMPNKDAKINILNYLLQDSLLHKSALRILSQI